MIISSSVNDIKPQISLFEEIKEVTHLVTMLHLAADIEVYFTAMSHTHCSNLTIYSC